MRTIGPGSRVWIGWFPRVAPGCPDCRLRTGTVERRCEVGEVWTLIPTGRQHAVARPDSWLVHVDALGAALLLEYHLFPLDDGDDWLEQGREAINRTRRGRACRPTTT